MPCRFNTTLRWINHIFSEYVSALNCVCWGRCWLHRVGASLHIQQCFTYQQTSNFQIKPSTTNSMVTPKIWVFRQPAASQGGNQQTCINATDVLWIEAQRTIELSQNHQNHARKTWQVTDVQDALAITRHHKPPQSMPFKVKTQSRGFNQEQSSELVTVLQHQNPSYTNMNPTVQD